MPDTTQHLSVHSQAFVSHLNTCASSYHSLFETLCWTLLTLCYLLMVDLELPESHLDELLCQSEWLPFPQVPSITVSVDGVVNLLQHLDPHKATGPDGIPAYFLKELSYEIAPILTLIFQSSLHQGFLPEEWKTANIIPIFKKGGHTRTCNYHPVLLTSICSKFLEHIIVYSCIFSHLNKQNILCKEQYGFQAGKSCETQLIITINNFVNCLNENSQIDCIFLDFSKAFDRAPHNRLCCKLAYYGIIPFVLD